MPKMKTRKCAAKRIRQTGTGKFRYNKCGARHLMTGKNAKRRRRLRNGGEVRSTELNRIKAALPYGVS